MKKTKDWPKKTLCLAASLILLGGGLSACTAQLLSPSSIGIFQRENVNLVQLNNAAADVLAGQIHSYLKPDDLIEAVPLTYQDNPNITSDAARWIIEQVATRLSMLSYRVDFRKVTPILKDAVPQYDIEDGEDFVLTGFYSTANRRALNVSLRVVEVGTGRIIGSYDYQLPVTAELREEVEAKPIIMRMPTQNAPQ